jgi:hypothetical protein
LVGFKAMTLLSKAAFSATPLALLAVCLAGCGTGSIPILVSPVTYSGAAFAGRVVAGGTPMIGSSVQLYAAGDGRCRIGAGATALECADHRQQWGLQRGCGL